jgi:hypothetical protein
VSTQARAFLRLRYWLEACDGGELRSPTDYERTLAMNLRVQAESLIGAAA